MTITEIVNQNPLPKQVRIVTHKGNFHSDDVAATALLRIYLKSKGIEPFLVRTFQPAYDGFTDDAPNTIVYDIGLGQYDHHQVGEDAKHCIRLDKVRGEYGKEETIVRKYAAVGLIWKEIGEDMVGKYADVVYDGIIRYIDDHDNGFGHNPLSTLIGNMNPITINPSDDEYDNHFVITVSFIESMLKRTIEKYRTQLMNEKELEKYAKPGNPFLISPYYISGADEVCRQNGIPFYIYPNQRREGAWCFKTICPDPKDLSKHIVDIPDEVRNWEGVDFLHPSCFLGSAVTKERAIEICEKLVAAHRAN